MDSHPRITLTTAFVLGILLTLGFKDFYPDLERRFRRGKPRVSTIAAAGLQDEEEHIDLEDHTQKIPTTEYGKQVPEGIESCVGQTPLFRIKSLSEATGCDILAKAEFLNGGGGSPKDRVALNIINTAEEQGLLTPHSGDTIYEGTSGSTGISLATLCRARGYLAHIVLPSDTTPEKASLLATLGAAVSLVPPAPIISPQHYVNWARSLAAAHTADPTRQGRGYFADQFENPANWQAHYSGTGPEILAQCGRTVDAFVAGAGTGGTISGVGMYLKEKIPAVKIVVADPQGSGLYNWVNYGVLFDKMEKEGQRRREQVDSIVEGIGMNRVTDNFQAGREVIDDVVRVSDEQALGMARWLVERDGIFVGSSSAVNCESGAALFAGQDMCADWDTGVTAVITAREMGKGKRIVTVLCDSGTKHISKFWAKAGSVGGETKSKLEDIMGLDY